MITVIAFIMFTGVLTGGTFRSLLISPHKFGFQHYPQLTTLNWNGSIVAYKTHEGSIPAGFNLKRYSYYT